MKQNYRLLGHYEQNNAFHGLSGHLQVISDGSTNLVLIDEGVNKERREARGKFSRRDGKTFLDFLVNVPGVVYCNIRYHLEKAVPAAEEYYGGNWIGTWIPEERTTAIKITGGSMELPSGDVCYPANVEKTMPKDADKKPQKAELYLEFMPKS